MSTEKDNELNEQELWDLLKDHEETDLQKPAKKKAEKKAEHKPAEEKPESKTIITEKRKKALVWYLVGLFGIAFVVVLLSLFLNGNGRQNPGTTDSTGENSAQTQELYDRINELEDKNADLQAQNRELQKQVLEQQEMMDGLNLMIDEMSNSLEYVEGSQYMDADAEQIARKIHVYETLVRAQAAFIDYDEEVLEAAMAEVGENLDLLSQDAVNAYYMVIEYMEQPYLGQN